MEINLLLKHLGIHIIYLSLVPATMVLLNLFLAGIDIVTFMIAGKLHGLLFANR